jgi:PAS domain S-box-containing protein
LSNALTIFEAPVGVYVVTTDGRFVGCNSRAREIFKLPSESIPSSSIVDFYVDSELRKKLCAKLEAIEDEGGFYSNVIPLTVKGNQIFVQDYGTSIRDPITHERLGYLCCVADITQEERYKQLFEKLPVGVYQLDKDDRIVTANEALARILGFDTPEKVKGKWVGDLYADREEADEFRRLFDKQGIVEDYKIELKRNNGETVIVSVYTVKVEGENGEYLGREGTMIDVTTEERLNRMLEHVPVGLYEARGVNGDYRITHCNEQFALIHQFEHANQAIGLPINILHANAQETQRYQQALEEHDLKKEPVIGYELKVRGKQGREFILEVNSRLLKNSAGNVIGRVGVVRDIHVEAALKQKVLEFTNDIGAVLHTYTSTLMILQHSISPVIDALSPTPFDPEKRILLEEVEQALSGPAKQLSQSVSRFIEFAKAASRMSALTPQQWDQLEYLRDFLLSSDQLPFLDLLPPTFGKAASTILGILKEIEGHTMPRELLKQLRTDAMELVRLANVIGLSQARELIFEMDHPVRALREHLTSQVRATEPRVGRTVSFLINEVVKNLYTFAESRGVRFEIRLSRPHVEVDVHEREIVRALGNLIHNAIKYSWIRTQGKQPWISIRDSSDGEEISLEIENWGVPITKDEIVEDLIFHIGYRGVYSSDRGRTGTGIGLTDARRVAQEHGGDVLVTSRPAISGSGEVHYKQAFLTMAVLKLPLSKLRRVQ